MEADSTTIDVLKNTSSRIFFPFISQPEGTLHRNLQAYLDIINKDGSGSPESQLVQSLQSSGLLASSIPCPGVAPECSMKCKPARVIDRMQWLCESCGAKQSVRYGSFFVRIPCSLLQVLQIILAWSEDAECEAVAQHLGVKPKVVSLIYDKLEDLVAEEQRQVTLGGNGSVVLAEMYPDCLNRLSPDTTDQPHGHRILMLTDTKHIPTRYCLRVVKEDKKYKALEKYVSDVVKEHVAENSTLVVGECVPAVRDAASLQGLLQHCDTDMRHFLSNRIWRQALTLCAASRDLCAATTPSSVCCSAVQRYLDAALYRLRYADGLFSNVLELVGRKYILPRV